MENYGPWKVLGVSPRSKTVLKCQCTCGIRKNIDIEELEKLKNTKCCHNIPNRKDISNKTFGTWKVLYPTSKGYYMCKCTCGCNTVKKIYGTTLRNGKSKSCGAFTTGFKNLKGQKFGEWTVLKYLGNHYWECQCSCKNKTIKAVHRNSLLNGDSKSCGCKTSELIVNKLIDNGYLSPRTEIQRDIVKNKQRLETFLSSLTFKPTPYQLSELLGLSRSWSLNYIHKYNLENYVDINSGVSLKEEELYNEITKLTNLTIERHNRTILNGQELDIYIPEKKIAIEFNGTYWHSAIYKPKKYHQQKTIDCAKHGVRLIHIFEYEWDNETTRNKILSIINNILNSSNKRVYGRDTYIKEITNYNCKDFLNKYHIQNSTQSSINIGCFSKTDKQLLGVMTFGKPRFNSEYEYELHRLCWTQGITVIGGSEKLFSYFLKNYNPTSIITYTDISKFTGNVYTKLGFKPIEPNPITEPNYVWINQKQDAILHRYQTQKHKLLKLGLGTENQTEDEIMYDNNYIKLFDCGNLKLEWLNNSAL